MCKVTELLKKQRGKSSETHLRSISDGDNPVFKPIIAFVLFFVASLLVSQLTQAAVVNVAVTIKSAVPRAGGPTAALAAPLPTAVPKAEPPTKVLVGQLWHVGIWVVKNFTLLESK